MCAGRVREAEADARLSFEFKLRHSALHALLWSLYPLVDALTETDQPESADAALAAAGVGDPPEGALTAPLLLQSRARLRLSQHRPEEALADLLDAGERWAPFGHAHPGLRLVARRRGRGARRARRARRGATARRDAPAARGAARAARADRRGAAGGRTHRGSRRTRRAARTRRRRARRLPGPARADPRARRPGRRPAAGQPPCRRARPAAPGLDLAERNGMRLLARRARDELHAAGARPRRAALATGPHALTAAETPRRTARGGGELQPRDRRAALRHPAHRRDAPHARLRQARHPRACGAGSGTDPQQRDHPGARAGRRPPASAQDLDEQTPALSTAPTITPMTPPITQ